MADNTTLNSGSGGDTYVSREISHAGDTAKLAGSFLMGISGTEGSYTAAAIGGDASLGLQVQVMASTLPSGAATSAKQDTAAAILTTIDADTGGIATSAASIDTKTPALGQALAAASVPVVLTASQLTTLTPPAAITGFATAANQLPDGHNVTVDNASIAVTGTFWQATQPVSVASVPSHDVTNAGTFAVQAAQSGTWTIDLGATDNAVLDTIAASLAGTLTVGSHAVTNAGTFVVQENGAALTALQLLDDGIYTTGSGTPSKGMLALGSDGTNPRAISTTTGGHVHIHDGGNTITVDGTVAAAQSGTWTVELGATDNAVLDAIAASLAGTLTVGSHAVTNAGTFAVQVDGTALTRLTDIETNTDSGAVVGNGAAATAQRVTLANDSTGIVALTTSTASIGKLAANSGVDIGDVDITSIAAGANLIGDVGLQPRTSGGLSIFRSIDLDESEEEVKGSAGQVYGVVAINLKATPLYLKLYNATAANVTVGSTTPVMTIPIPSQGSTNGAGFVMNVPMGIAFSTAISAAVTTGVADADTGAPGANEAIVNILYK